MTPRDRWRLLAAAAALDRAAGELDHLDTAPLHPSRRAELGEVVAELDAVTGHVDRLRRSLELDAAAPGVWL